MTGDLDITRECSKCQGTGQALGTCKTCGGRRVVKQSVVKKVRFFEQLFSSGDYRGLTDDGTEVTVAVQINGQLRREGRSAVVNFEVDQFCYSLGDQIDLPFSHRSVVLQETPREGRYVKAKEENNLNYLLDIKVKIPQIKTTRHALLYERLYEIQSKI